MASSDENRARRGQPGNKTLTKSTDEEYISEYTHEERVQMMKDRQERLKERKRIENAARANGGVVK